MHTDSCFLTLTYDTDNLPYDYSLNKKHFQDFMKRLRKKYGTGLRYFHCGEYGTQGGRPHYHALLFGLDFKDKRQWKVQRGNTLFVSKELDQIWGLGFCSLGSVTFQSAGYVARYITKKQYGEVAEDYYKYICPVTGEIFNQLPPYVTMSRMPGIGYSWYQMYKRDLINSNTVVVDGREMAAPRYYYSLMEREDPTLWRTLRGQKVALGRKNPENSTPDRLKVREVVTKAKVNQLKREIE